MCGDGGAVGLGVSVAGGVLGLAFGACVEVPSSLDTTSPSESSEFMSDMIGSDVE